MDRVELPLSKTAPLSQPVNPVTVVVFNTEALRNAWNANASNLARWRLVRTQLAARAYWLREGSPPAKIGSLVPKYLPEAPVDPYTGQTLKWRAEDQDMLTIYSVGPDGVDDGGSGIGDAVRLESEGDIAVTLRAPQQNGDGGMRQ